MWLDAFKPKTGNIQIIGATGATGVTPPNKANEYGALAVTRGCNTSINQSVTGATEKYCVALVTPRSTAANTRRYSAAPPRKANEYVEFVDSVAPVTPVTPHKQVSAENAETLAQFSFDLVQQEIEAGYPVEELRRVNNIAWRLITARGYPFKEAMTAAAQWVVDNPPHRDEAAFVDVMALFKGMRQ